MAKNITLEISATNLGPHENLSAKLNLSSMKLGIYANNGSGKTFLSRAFRQFSNPTFNPNNTNRLLTIDKNEGEFKVKILNSTESGVIRELKFNIEKNAVPICINTSEYIVRVFNEEYIKENLEVSKYKPNGQIEGYILGKEKIDISREKEDLKNFEADFQKKDKNLKTKVEDALQELSDLSIRKNTTEFQIINLVNLVDYKYLISEKESYSDLVNMHNRVKSLPDNLPDLRGIERLKNPDILNLIIDFLEQEYSKSAIAEDFKSKIKSKQNFIEIGLDIIKDSKVDCPFCEQELKEDALNLIDKYLEYFSETEALQIKKANDLHSTLFSLKRDYYKLYQTTLAIQTEYLKNQKFIPSLSESNLFELVDPKTLETEYENIVDALDRKKSNVEISINDEKLRQSIEKIREWAKDSNIRIQANGFIIQDFNNKKNNIHSEKLELNRRLCRAKFLELRNLNEKEIREHRNLSDEIRLVKDDIREKEQSEKTLKKDKVVETFKTLLTRFFAQKYSFDEETFCLKFRNHILKSNASDVLSTGEKSIVAFCYYIAESHKFIDKEDDYKNLFFIVDDPISSQDFHYVYATAQMIRTLNQLFDIPYIKLFVFTHNLEFMSILIRNKIIDQKFVLSEGKIESLSNELIMPYEEHLRDVYKISNGEKKPNHTTANSIRHILETINRFIAPDVELSVFCERIHEFSDNEYLYSLMHDNSHGGIRNQKAFTEEMLKKACTIVINHVTKEFSGQLKGIK